MNEIFVIGHRNPDTDSIAAAMSYAALRNALGGQYRVRTDDLFKWWDGEVKQEQKNIIQGVLR